MKFILLEAASAEEVWAREAEVLYKKKLEHFIKFEIISVKLKKSSRDNRELKVQADSAAILEQIKPDDFVVIFDERGKNFDSIQFSKKIENILNSSKQRAVFVIGGAFGLSNEIKTRADLSVSFSPMVFNHLVARTVALEQIYRAFTILKNIPYHNI